MGAGLTFVQGMLSISVSSPVCLRTIFMKLSVFLDPGQKPAAIRINNTDRHSSPLPRGEEMRFTPLLNPPRLS